MDPLSTLLSLLKPHSHTAGRFDVGQRQAIEFPAFTGVKCYAVVSGGCCLVVDDQPGMLQLSEGDCFLLPHGHAFSLAAEPGSPPVDFAALVKAMQGGLPGLYEGNPACTFAGGHFVFGGEPVDLLLQMLPPVIHLRKSRKGPAVRWSLERIREELMQEQLGSSFLVQQLAYCMLVDVLRAFLAEAEPDAVGWLHAMADPQLSRALSSIHDRPSHPWTLGSLAQHVGMSRSLFAHKFKQKVGESPIDHLTRWRMLLAANHLAASEDPVIQVATRFGYQSESAFGKAFKRVTGRSPRQYKSFVRAAEPPM